jgi:hypothetical protein
MVELPLKMGAEERTKHFGEIHKKAENLLQLLQSNSAAAQDPETLQQLLEARTTISATIRLFQGQEETAGRFEKTFFGVLVPKIQEEAVEVAPKSLTAKSALKTLAENPSLKLRWTESGGYETISRQTGVIHRAFDTVGESPEAREAVTHLLADLEDANVKPSERAEAIAILQKNEWVQEVLKNKKNVAFAVRFAALADPKYKESFRELDGLRRSKHFMTNTPVDVRGLIETVVSKLMEVIKNPTDETLSSFTTAFQLAGKGVKKGTPEFKMLMLAFNMSRVLIGIAHRH